MTVLKVVVKKNTYYDSASLMRISSILTNMHGIIRAAVMMGTLPNKEILDKAGMLNDSAQNYQPSDLIISVLAENEQLACSSIEKAENMLTERDPYRGATRSVRTLDTALRLLPDANIALVSIPGNYASAEVKKALSKSLNVFLFSDNVGIEDEVQMKKAAVQNGLLLMGPDCGTAYFKGVGLGFANAIRCGQVGIVAAAGTGLQEVGVVLHQLGEGISFGIGVGGRDLKEPVNGIMTSFALKILSDDSDTKIIMVIGKSGDERVIQKILQEASVLMKPVIVVILGYESKDTQYKNIKIFNSLEEAALEAARLLGIKEVEKWDPILYEQKIQLMNAPQKYLRGLYSGGTLLAEALLVLQTQIGACFTNSPLGIHKKLTDPEKSFKHTLIDMGDDFFTLGKPHPMIDQTTRIDRIYREVSDPEVGCILLDVELGFGAHFNPASELAPVIKKITCSNKTEGGSLSVFISLLGTSQDPQQFDDQAQQLYEAGASIYRTTSAAARAAANFVKRR